MVQQDLTEKLSKLEEIIRSYGRVIVGYSGGVDSTLVAFIANKVLGSHALIILSRTETIIQEDVELARHIAKLFGFNFREIAYSELEIQEYASNPINRCYFCKQELYSQLKAIATNEKYPFIVDGANTDDLGDYRPGRIAAKKSLVCSPLIEASFSKQDVRAAAAVFGLPNADKPAAPCLSSRIPYGTFIDRKSLEQIASAEKYIREKGFLNVRVRHHSSIAKVEVDACAVNRLKQMRQDVEMHLKQLGYAEIVIDEEGFKSGKLNRGIVNR